VSVVEPVAPRRVAGATHTDCARFHKRRLAAVLFTDIVGSATHAWELGDRAWCELLETHDELVRHELDRFAGREIDASDDGFFASFDGVTAAIECALAIRSRLDAIGLAVRSGVHAGEFEDRGSRLGGIAVAVGARIASMAGSGEVLATRTVRDLVLGSGVRFSPRGPHSLKGIPGCWDLFAVEAVGAEIIRPQCPTSASAS
jgi:class 3 adenylate cyclase